MRPFNFRGSAPPPTTTTSTADTTAAADAAAQAALAGRRGPRPGPSRGVPPTTTTTSSSTTTTTGSGSSTGIVPWRGAGLVDLPADCSDIQTLGLSWYYNWETTSPCASPGVPFVPMQWGDWCSGQSTCTALPASLAANGNKYLLTFNEPDNSSQSNMTVARALQLWPYLEATGLELSSPAVTSSSTGTAWLASFMAQARAQGLRVDFIAAHWYGDCSNPQNLISYLTSLETYGLPIWLTEFSCLNDSLAENTQFFTAVAPLLAALPSVQRFAWFTNRPYPNGYQYTSLLDANGNLTTTGQAFVDVPAAMNASRQLVPWPGS
ncbi:MAG: glycoside hydrolase family protein [Acidimicrobiales bacterium]